MIDVMLPLPPSANGLFRNVRGGGRIKTERYKYWITNAGWVLAIKHPPAISGRYHMLIMLPPSARGDPDNYVKPLSDLFVTHRLIEDDSPKYCAGVQVIANCKMEISNMVRVQVSHATGSIKGDSDASATAGERVDG